MSKALLERTGAPLLSTCRGGLRSVSRFPGFPVLPALALKQKGPPMATKKAKAARAKFARQARAKGSTKVSRRAKSTATPKRKRRK